MNCNTINSVHIALILITRDALISQFFIWNRTLRVSHRVFVHQEESNTVYTAISICHTVLDS